MPKTAAIYWPTSSVGGINTELVNLRRAADSVGETFHVFRSGQHKSMPIGLYDPETGSRELMRGGDTFISVDGELPHAPNNYLASVEYLKREKYTNVYLAFLCPHPTKDYGDVPNFLPFLEEIKRAKIPIAGRVTDGYWESYKEWGERTIALCETVTVSQPAFASFFKHKSVKASRFPFFPIEPQTISLYTKKLKPERAKKVLTVWTSQWKAIKGIHKLLPYIPEIKGDVELYSNGILYYQLRTTPEWEAAVGSDFFGATTPSGDFPGTGKADFYGYIPLEHIPTVLSRAWFMIDLMGIGKPKNKVYTEGSFNNTTVEALYYGSCPILHRQASKVVPVDTALFVDDAKEVPELINKRESQQFALDKGRQKRAKAWVLDNFDAVKLYRQTVLNRR